MGTGVFGGMLASTFIATIFVPMFFTWMSRNQPKKLPASGTAQAGADAHSSTTGEKS
jgi:hypothetical protein